MPETLGLSQKLRATNGITEPCSLNKCNAEVRLISMVLMLCLQHRPLCNLTHNNYKASVLSEGQGFGPYVTRPFSAGHKMRLHFTYMYMIVCMQGSYGGGKGPGISPPPHPPHRPPLVGTYAYVCVNVLSHATIILLPSFLPPQLKIRYETLTCPVHNPFPTSLLSSLLVQQAAGLLLHHLCSSPAA